jgi:hypothetical protein
MLTIFKRRVLKLITNFFPKRGYYVAQPHFSNPIPDKKYILSHDGYWKRPYPCYGIEFDDEEQLILCEQLSKFAPEINGLPEDILDAQKNTSFLDMDLEFLYCMIRLLKPKRFIEIGAGWSSLIAMHAICHNREEGHICEHTIIEPYPGKYFHQFFEKADRYITKPIQEVPESVFNGLSYNDILFIDTSHIAKYGSDVNYIYFYIVPMVGKDLSYIFMMFLFRMITLKNGFAKKTYFIRSSIWLWPF